MPKREGYILEKVADIENLRAADKEAQEGRKRLNRHIRRHNARAEEDLRELRRMILELDFPKPEYRTVPMRSRTGKWRDIAKHDYYPWHILEHAIMRVIGPRVYKSLVTDTCASIKGRGLHYGVRRLRKMMRLHPECRWYWKTDYKKFYQSIPHGVVKAALERLYKDKRFIKLVEMTLLTYCQEKEIEDEIERERRKSHADRSLYEPAVRRTRRKLGRPRDEGEGQGQVLREVLRRHVGAGGDQGGGVAATEGVREAVGGVRLLREGELHNSPARLAKEE